MNPYAKKIEEELAKAKAIEAAAKDGMMSAEELDQYTAHLDEVDKLTVLSEKWEAAQKRVAELGKPVTPKAVKTAVAVQVADQPNLMKDPMKGFSSPKEFFGAVVDATKNKSLGDDRMKMLHTDKNMVPHAAVGSDEQSTQYDPYGGFLIPEGMSPDLLKTTSQGDPTVGRVTNVPMSSPIVKINARVDKDHATSVSGGLTFSRTPETATPQSSRQKYEQIKLEVNKLTGLSFVTDELMNDSPVSVAALLQQGYQEEYGSTMIDEKLNGGGVGMYEGVLKSDALVVVPKESAQPADTIVADNITKMVSRFRGNNGIWFANQTTMPQLAKIGGDDNGNGQLIWMPSIEDGTPARLMGMPIVFMEHMELLGNQGDLLLGDWSQYLEAIYTPLQSSESMHVRFIEGETCFKVETRNDGKCWWTSPLKPKKSAPTLSPFVTLADRD